MAVGAFAARQFVGRLITQAAVSSILSNAVAGRITVHAWSTGKIRANLQAHANIIVGNEERFNQVFTEAVASELRRRLIPKLRNATPARTGRAKRGYYIIVTRQGGIRIMNRAFYAPISDFSRSGGFDPRKFCRRALKSMLPGVYRRAYETAARVAGP